MFEEAVCAVQSRRRSWLATPSSELEVMIPLLRETLKAALLVTQICLHMLDFD